MTNAQTIELAQLLWYGSETTSPKLPDKGFTLCFETRPANSPNGPTLALFGAARLPGTYGEMYGGRVTGATEILAINVTSGQLYRGKPEDANATPLTPVIVEPRDAGSGKPKLLSLETYFNLDLGYQLSLGPTEGTYHVFCWLDEFVTRVHMVKVPANPNRPHNPEAHPVVNAAQVIEFKESKHSPEPGPAKIALHAKVSRNTVASDPGISVFAALDTAQIREKPPLPNSVPSRLNIFVRSHLDRVMQWCSLFVPEEVMLKSRGKFEFDPFRIMEAPKTPQKVFILATFDSVRSDVFVLDLAKLTPTSW
ncbi:MAG TPA: hypothetical protein VMW72_26165 [Sedimentisphaerales bacterium]|nr:hypothetical protein [Sedimentisphaerales bacterium]